MIKVKKCEWCKGSGIFDKGVDGYRDCRRCDGRGLRPLEISEIREIKINELLKDDKKISTHLWESHKVTIFDKVKKLIKS